MDAPLGRLRMDTRLGEGNMACRMRVTPLLVFDDEGDDDKEDESPPALKRRVGCRFSRALADLHNESPLGFF